MISTRTFQKNIPCGILCKKDRDLSCENFLLQMISLQLLNMLDCRECKEKLQLKCIIKNEKAEKNFYILPVFTNQSLKRWRQKYLFIVNILINPFFNAMKKFNQGFDL